MPENVVEIVITLTFSDCPVAGTLAGIEEEARARIWGIRHSSRVGFRAGMESGHDEREAEVGVQALCDL
jgi:metal-sulfur cluster biosynthetic enzyme